MEKKTEKEENVKSDKDTKNSLTVSIKKATKNATTRLFIYGFILLVTLYAVYAIITNPDFLHSALSFKTIDDDEGVVELVSYSNEVSEQKSRAEQLAGSLNDLNDVKKKFEAANDSLIKVITTVRLKLWKHRLCS